MAMYAIKDTTLTAIGDAVRGKTGKYIGGFDEPILEPFVDITIDTTAMEPTDTNSSYVYFSVPIDLSNYMDYPYLYFTYEYETPQRYYAYHAQCALYWTKTSALEFVSLSDRELTKTGNGFTTPSTPNPNAMVMINAPAYDKGATVMFKLKLWFCDSNKKFYKLNTYTPLEMVDAINGIMPIPDEGLTITDSCSYRFAYNGWNWFIEQVGDKITTNNITNPGFMFYLSNKLQAIPFDINTTGTNQTMTSMFESCNMLMELPRIYNAYPENMKSLFNGCHKVREIPEDYFDTWTFDRIHTYNYSNISSLFSNMYSLRNISPKILEKLWGAATSSSYVIYSSGFQNCYALDEIVGLAVCPAKYTSNVFSNSFNYCIRLKELIFQTNEDGTPQTAQWKSQTIDLTKGIGYNSYSGTTYIINYNSGITADKEVKDDATYQALKNDPDWFSCNINYSRYNHDSAVNTINSLPDCSATGTNTIKFKGAAGALTDGGAINTLTEAEIAVAAAKGWTVTFA